MPKQKVLVIGGPTASGKKNAALMLAEQFGGEIVSADSRKVYGGMDIGTAKPTLEMRARLPHHLIDITDIDRPFSAGDWTSQASTVVRDIIERGRLPILSGGTGFYLKAFIEGLSEGIEPGPGVRERLEAELKEHGPEALYRRLADIDPDRAAVLHPNDTFRVMRALEVCETTGLSFAEAAKEPVGGVTEYEFLEIGITREREYLYRQCDERVDTMVEAGLESEVCGILDSGIPRETQALDTVGYREWFAYFDGARTLEETLSLIKRNTRRYAKRQLTWFNARPNLVWYNAGAPDMSDRIATAVIRWLKGHDTDSP